MASRKATSVTVQDLIAQFYQDFPEQRERIYFLLHGSENSADEKRALANIRRDIHAKIKNKPVGTVARVAADLWARYHHGIENVCVISYFEKAAKHHFDIPAHIVFLPSDLKAKARNVSDAFADDFENLTGRSVRHQLRRMLLSDDAFSRFVFDHETAHARLMDGMPRRPVYGRDIDNYNECMADVYAVLRHLTRGGNIRFVEGIIAARALATVGNSDVGHHTIAAVSMARDIFTAGEIKDKTPQALSDLAVRIAEETALTEKDMVKIKSAFNNAAARSMAGRFRDLSLLERAQEFIDRLRRKQPAATPDPAEQYQNFMQWLHTVGSKARAPAVTEVSAQFFRAASSLVPRAERPALRSTLKRLQDKKPETFAKSAAQTKAAYLRILKSKADRPQSLNLRHRIFSRNKKPAT